MSNKMVILEKAKEDCQISYQELNESHQTNQSELEKNMISKEVIDQC